MKAQVSGTWSKTAEADGSRGNGRRGWGNRVSAVSQRYCFLLEGRSRIARTHLQPQWHCNSLWRLESVSIFLQRKSSELLYGGIWSSPSASGSSSPSLLCSGNSCKISLKPRHKRHQKRREIDGLQVVMGKLRAKAESIVNVVLGPFDPISMKNI